MSYATTTLGYSIDGGYQAGTATLPTLGYDIAEVAAGAYLCGEVRVFPRLTGKISGTIRLAGEVSTYPRLNGRVVANDC